MKSEPVPKVSEVKPETAGNTPEPKVQVGEWFFLESPNCTNRFSVQEKTHGGSSIVCSTPYHHDYAKRQLQEIVTSHNERVAASSHPKTEDGNTPELWIDFIATAYAVLNSGFLQKVFPSQQAAEKFVARELFDSPEVEIREVRLTPVAASSKEATPTELSAEDQHEIALYARNVSDVIFHSPHLVATEERMFVFLQERFLTLTRACRNLANSKEVMPDERAQLCSGLQAVTGAAHPNKHAASAEATPSPKETTTAKVAEACRNEFKLRHGYFCELPKNHVGEHEAACPNPAFSQRWPQEATPSPATKDSAPLAIDDGIDVEFAHFKKFASDHDLLMNLDYEDYEFESAHTQIARDAWQEAWNVRGRLVSVAPSPATKETHITPHGSVINTDLCVSCICGKHLIWRYLEDEDAIQVFHCDVKESAVPSPAREETRHEALRLIEHDWHYGNLSALRDSLKQAYDAGARSSQGPAREETLQELAHCHRKWLNDTGILHADGFDDKCGRCNYNLSVQVKAFDAGARSLVVAPQSQDLIEKVKCLLEWMPICSEGSSGYLRRIAVEKAIDALAGVAAPKKEGE